MRQRMNRIHLYLSDDEYKCLQNKVSLSKLSREAFLRKLILDVKIKEAPPVDYHILIREIRRVGNNINQLLALANARGLIITDDLRNSLNMLNNAVQMLYDSFTKGNKKWQ